MWAQLDFFPGNIYNFVFSDKKENSNSKDFAHMGFCGSKVLIKFCDFAAGIDLDT